MNLSKLLDMALPGAHLRKIRSLLDTNPDCTQPPALHRSVAMSDVPHWESFGKGALTYWRANGSGYYSATFAEIPAIADLIETRTSFATVDIRNIHGILHSKSDLHGHLSLDAWAEEYAGWALDDASLSAVEKLLHSRSLDTTSDALVVHDYDGRTFLSNSDGSHRFAAARYLAGQLDEPVLFRAPVTHYGVNHQALGSLHSRFAAFAVRRDPVFINELYDAFDAGKVAYMTCDMPARLGGEGFGTASAHSYRAIVLSKDDASARKVIELFEASPAMNVLVELKRQCMDRAHMLALEEQPVPMRAALR